MPHDPFTTLVPAPAPASVTIAANLQKADAAVFEAILGNDVERLADALNAGGGANTLWRQNIEADHDAWTVLTTPLVEAVKRPQGLAMLNVLLAAGADPFRYEDPAPWLLLKITGMNENWAIMHRLLDITPSPQRWVSKTSTETRAIFHQVLHHAQTSMFRRLMDAGWWSILLPSDENLLNTFVRTQSRRADMTVGWSDMLDAVVGVDQAALNPVEPVDAYPKKWTPLALAVDHNNLAMVQALVERGADVHRCVRQDCWDDTQADRAPMMVWADEGISPLHLAAGKNLPLMCQTLLHHGANPWARAQTSWTHEESQSLVNASPGPHEALKDHERRPLTALDTAQRNGAWAAATVIESWMLRRLDVAPTLPSLKPNDRRRL